MTGVGTNEIVPERNRGTSKRSINVSNIMDLKRRKRTTRMMTMSWARGADKMVYCCANDLSIAGFSTHQRMT